MGLFQFVARHSPVRDAVRLMSLTRGSGDCAALPDPQMVLSLMRIGVEAGPKPHSVSAQGAMQWIL
jgi:hypothetical protein